MRDVDLLTLGEQTYELMVPFWREVANERGTWCFEIEGLHQNSRLFHGQITCQLGAPYINCLKEWRGRRGSYPRLLP